MIKKSLENLNIDALNAMQLEVIDASKKPNDIILLSPTGSGKTVAFLLPIIESLHKNVDGVQALIVVPSRELALQIEQVFKQMSTSYKVNCCYGGHATRTEINNLIQPPAVLIGTPGRLAFHIRSEYIDTSSIHFLVLDEFDKAMEYGFQDDMTFIVNSLRKLKKRMLTSATGMKEIPKFARLNNAVEINYLSHTPVQAEGLKLKIVNSTTKDKIDSVFSLICKLGNKATLIFCNHRDAVDRISELLNRKGLIHGTFHGKMEQEDRERSLIKFRNGTYQILITTDLASRGLDIPEIQNIIHFQLPATEEILIHRNGRTARMNATGTAFIIIGPDEHLPKFIKEVPEEETMPSKNKIPDNTPWCTLYIGAGKKDKINKMDIVGMLLQKGKLHKDDLGRIEVLDFSAYAAVKRNAVSSVLKLIKDEKIKNRKIKIEESK